jgi:hypothetical protein
LWLTEFVGDFEHMTTKRVVSELERRFKGDALLWIKQQYAMNHLTLMLKSDGIDTAESVLTAVSAFDPTGLTGVIDAYANPKCAAAENFPTVALLPPYGPPLPAPPLAGGLYTLTARHSSKCLDVEGANSKNGANVQQWDCNNGNNQKWSLVSKGGEVYTLAALHSGKCLDVAGARNDNGADVLQWDCHGKDNQTWRITKGGDGYFRLAARHSSKCLDVASASVNNGANVIQWDCHNGNNQKWKISSVLSAPTVGDVLKWVASTGAVPANAVIGGQEPGRTLPICRGAYQGGVHPGKVVAGKCNIGWGGKEIILGSFEVLVSDNAKLAWVPGPTATGMVIGGQEPGRTLPICRIAYQGGVHPGKVVAGKCNIGWGGKEITLGSFEVLVQK